MRNRHRQTSSQDTFIDGCEFVVFVVLLPSFANLIASYILLPLLLSRVISSAMGQPPLLRKDDFILFGNCVSVVALPRV